MHINLPENEADVEKLTEPLFEHIGMTAQKADNLIAENKKMKQAIKGIFAAITYGDRGNIRDKPYVCLCSESDEIRALIKAVNP